MDSDFKTQVDKDHYLSDYDSLYRFISYFYQIDFIKNLHPKTLLEIGIGNKTVSNYLIKHGIEVTTCDFDKSLEPDVVSDIRMLPFEDKSFDAVSACQILEHIPWEDFDKALSELSRVSNKYVLISLPYCSASFELIIKFPLILKLFHRPIFDLNLKIPCFFLKAPISTNEHYWELGIRGYSKKKIRNSLKRYFVIEKEFEPPLNHYHHFFLLRKI